MKLPKVILINLLLISAVFLVLEYFVYKEELKISPDYFPFLYPYYTLDANKKWDVTFDDILHRRIKNDEPGFRPVYINSGIDIKKPGVILFGCSFAYGSHLKDNETLSYFLSKYAERIVYNRAFSGWGTQGMLYQTEKPDFVSSLKYSIMPKNAQKPDFNNIEYAVYVYMGDHLRRLFMSCIYFDDKLLFYKYNKKTGRLERKSNFDNFYWHSYLSRRIYRINKAKTAFNHDACAFLLKHIKQSSENLKQMLPETKFIVFVYDDDESIKYIEKELNDAGIEVIYLSKLSNTNFHTEEYNIPGFGHPNAKAWEAVSKLLVKKLNL